MDTSTSTKPLEDTATPKRAKNSFRRKITRLLTVMAILFVLDVIFVLLGWNLFVRTLADFLLVSLTVCWLIERNE